jgi:hypothetical protein
MWGVFLLLAGSSSPGVRPAHGFDGSDKNVAQVLPPSAVIYFQLPEPGKVIDTLLAHPLRKKMESLAAYQEALKSPQYDQFRFGVSAIEGGFEMPVDEALKRLTAGGVHVAVDAKTQGLAVLIKAADKETLKKVHSTVVGLLRLAGNQQDPNRQLQTNEYRGYTVHTVNDVKFTLLDDWLLVTNQRDLGKWIVDSWLDGNEQSLASNDRFQAARKMAGSTGCAWLYVDLQTLREAGVADKVFREKADNPLAEVLLGGILQTARHTPFLAVALDLQTHHLAVEATTPFDNQWVGPSRQYYFGPSGHDPAPPLLQAKETVFALSAYRDISRMWLQAGDLFDDNINDELSKANSNLTTLFSGKDFGEEILGAIHPPIQLVVTRQRFDGSGPIPAIKLPAFALVGRLKDPQAMQPELRRTFQSLIGFVNITGAMNGQPQLDLDNQRSDGRQIVSANYVPAADEQNANRINYNFSPSVAFVGDRFIVASTRQLAAELAELADEQPVPANTHARLSASVLRSILDDNRQHLVAQNMLEQGHDKEEAERQIGDLLSILDALESAALRLGVDQDQHALRLRFEVTLAAQAGQ